MCLFAAMLGLGRYMYAKKGDSFNLNNLMILGSLACVLCYLVVAAAPSAWLVLAAFGLIGFCSCLLWTGTILVAAGNLPDTGAILLPCWQAGRFRYGGHRSGCRMAVRFFCRPCPSWHSRGTVRASRSHCPCRCHSPALACAAVNSEKLAPHKK